VTHTIRVTLWPVQAGCPPDGTSPDAIAVVQGLSSTNAGDIQERGTHDHDRGIKARSTKSSNTVISELLGSVRIATNLDLERLEQALGPNSFRCMEREEDEKKGKPPRKVISGVRMVLPNQEGQVFILEMAIGFDVGQETRMGTYSLL